MPVPAPPLPRRWPALLPLAAALALSLAACAPREPAVDVEGIAAVQGRGERSAFEGRRARIEGVVTLRFEDGNGGVFVQSLVPDADPETAEGLFLLPAPGQPELRVGQHLRATGTVAEAGPGEASLTTLADAEVRVLGEAPLPAPVVLDAPPPRWEALEGMRVRIEAPLTVTGNEALAQYGELRLAFGGRLMTPTEVVPPGVPALARQGENQARMIRLDDARAAQNPDPIAWLPEPLSPAAPLRAGSVLHGVAGVVDQRFGAYRVQAEAEVERIEQAPRPAAPQVAGSLRIAGMNLLNLFNGDGMGGGFPTARGAASAEDYQRQRAKLVAVVQGLDPDIIAAQEMENDGFGPESSARQFAAALEAAQPGARWQVVAPEVAPGSDQIAVALLYRADRVQAVGRPALKLDGPFQQGSRPPLAQSFRQGRGPVFTVVSLHFKSKGGCGEAQGADANQGDGQACFNAQRVESARVLADWIASDPTASGSDRVALVGDFNAYGMEDPIRLLRERGFIDPWQGEESHSFVFDGQAGRLDHALLSPSLHAALRGKAKWAVNSDESVAFAYDGALGRAEETPTPWRSSDHDPLLLGFELR